MRILIFVEGKWDKEFAERILTPLFKRKYRNSEVNVRTFSNTKKELIATQVNWFENKGLWAFIADHDKHRSQCIQSRREELRKTYSLPSITPICLAVREIEDWYSLGITQKTAERLAIPDWQEGKLLGKDFFENHSKSEIVLRAEILNGYSLETAMQSDSFRYFIDKYGLIDM